MSTEDNSKSYEDNSKSYEVGELVLCFEPDSTKARVLYDAKILKVTSSLEKDKERHGFEVHFQGWNSSWDRIVPESFILKSTHANRKLMKKLADVARRTRKNYTRKRKIDLILKKHFYHTPKLHSSDSSEVDSGGEDIYLSDLDDSNDIDSDDDKTKSAPLLSESQNTEESMEENTEHDDGLSFEAGSVEIDIPKSLQDILEDDANNICTKYKLLKLPADPNVVTILESYAKHFAINVMYTSIEKLRSRDTFPPPPERNIDFVKEMLDSLRIIFDVYLPSHLLYNCEKQQYEKFSSSIDSTWLKNKVNEFINLSNSQKTVPSILQETATKKRRTNDKNYDEEGQNNSIPMHPLSNNSSRCSTPTLQEVSSLNDKEGALNGVLSWRIIPSEDYFLSTPVPASAIYGIHHLLRLFVKLSDIICKMPIPITSLKPLLKHIALFINYITEHCEDFTSQSAYIDDTLRMTEET